MAKVQENTLTFTGSEATFIDRYASLIADENTVRKLAMISATEAVTAYAGIKLAYYMNNVTDQDAKREGMKTATEMIEKVCGLKKSMIGNYRTVGAMVTDENGNFALPDAFKGFSVTQLLEAKQKLGTAEKVETSIKEGEIDCTMSAKKIRENLTTQEEAEKESAKKQAAKRSNVAKTAKAYGKENGVPVCINTDGGEAEIIGYVIADCAYDVFINAINSGFAFIQGKEKTFSIREQ